MKNLKTFWRKNQALLLSLTALVLSLGTLSVTLAVGTAVVLVGLFLVYYCQEGERDLLVFLEEQLDSIWQVSKTFLSNQLHREKSQVSPQVVASSTAYQQQEEAPIQEGGGTSKRDYNKSEESFKLKKRGYGINIFIYIVTLFPAVYLLGLFVAFDQSSSDIGLILMVLGGVLLSTYIYLLPTFICHSGAKFFIFIFNVFLGVTIIGWIVLLFWAMSSNRAYDTEQEMKYIMRKMSDRL